VHRFWQRFFQLGDTTMSDSERPVQPGETEPPFRLLTAKQLGRLLGLSERTIRRHDAAGLVPRPLSIGGAVRWRADEIDAWIKAGCPKRLDWERRK
jgi:predicted DNA-binding transcriptional regulator AlpA